MNLSAIPLEYLTRRFGKWLDCIGGLQSNGARQLVRSSDSVHMDMHGGTAKQDRKATDLAIRVPCCMVHAAAVPVAVVNAWEWDRIADRGPHSSSSAVIKQFPAHEANRGTTSATDP
jgi:hypothetical protein